MTATGGAVVAASAAAGLIAAFFLRARARAAVVAAVLAAAGAGVGFGAMLLQRDPSLGERIAAIVALAALVPWHVRVVLGPLGPHRAGAGSG